MQILGTVSNLFQKTLRGKESRDTKLKWKVTLTSHGSYKIKAKSSESYTSIDLVMDMETSSIYTEGLNIRQRVYANNTSYKDEWRLRCITNAYSFGGEFYSGDDVMDASDNWEACGYDSKYIINPKLTDLCQENLNSSVVYFSSHGKQHQLDLPNNLHLTDGLSTSPSNSKRIDSFTLNSAKLYIYDACLTASNVDKSGKNLCTQTIAAGAECVIGWQMEITNIDAQKWQVRFQQKLVSGSTVQEAANHANTFSYNDNEAIKSLIIYGNSSLVINVDVAANTYPIYSIASTLNHHVTETNIPIQSIDEIDTVADTYIKDHSFKRTVAYTNLDQSDYVVDYVLLHNGFSTDYGISVIVQNHVITKIAHRPPNNSINSIRNNVAGKTENDSINDILQTACAEIAQAVEYSRIVEQKYDLYYESNTNQYYYRVITVYETPTGAYGADCTLHNIND